MQKKHKTANGNNFLYLYIYNKMATSRSLYEITMTPKYCQRCGHILYKCECEDPHLSAEEEITRVPWKLSDRERRQDIRDILTRDGEFGYNEETLDQIMEVLFAQKSSLLSEIREKVEKLNGWYRPSDPYKMIVEGEVLKILDEIEKG